MGRLLLNPRYSITGRSDACYLILVIPSRVSGTLVIETSLFYHETLVIESSLFYHGSVGRLLLNPRYSITGRWDACY